MVTEKLTADFDVDRDSVARYFFWLHLLLILLIGVWFFGVGLLVALLYAVLIGPWLPTRQAQAFKYWLDQGTLCIDQGVYFLKRKAIPLDRVTDVALVQGPLMRHFGIWTLHVQTTGTEQQIPEGIFYGIRSAIDCCRRAIQRGNFLRTDELTRTVRIILQA